MATRPQSRNLFGLAGLTVLTLAMVAARMHRAHNVSFSFMAWNLFLAWMPLLFAVAIERMDRARASAWLLAPVALLWLLTFPNAPYVATDLIHLHDRPPIPMWFDAMMLFCGAWTGCALGFLSLERVQRVVENRFGNSAGWPFAAAVLMLSAIGVALGRFDRFNSWDALRDPLAIIEALRPLLHPLAHQGMSGFVLAFAAFTTVAYRVMARSAA